VCARRRVSLPTLTRTFDFLTSRLPAETAVPLDRQRIAGLPGSAGDDVFEAFFHAHEREIFGYLWRLTGDEYASYDLAQETFVRAWQHFEQLHHYEQPRAWLFRVATNLASNYRRHRSVESDAVRAALHAMPVKQRGALVLRVVYGLTLAELARALGTSEAAAKMTLSRAREQFRANYSKEESR
jgi:RNA polymerase sigma-70 factor (ECF subfamily)